MATENDPPALAVLRPLIRWLCGWKRPIPGREADWAALSHDPVTRLAGEPIVE